MESMNHTSEWAEYGIPYSKPITYFFTNVFVLEKVERNNFKNVFKYSAFLLRKIFDIQIELEEKN